MAAAQAESQPIRILFLDHTAQLGGGEIALLHLIEALDKTRFEPVVVLGSNGPLAADLRELGVDVTVCELDPELRDARKGSLGFSTILKLRSAVRLCAYARRIASLAQRRRVQLIHTNSLKSDIYGGIAGRLAGIPVLWHVRDRIDDNYLPPLAARAFRLLCGALPHAVVANSKSTLGCLDLRDSAGRRFGFVSPPTGSVVYDGVRLPSTATSEPASTTDHPVIALVGRIAEWKGQHIFIESAARVLRSHPGAEFWIIGAPLFGETEYEAGLRRMTASLGIEDSVKFLGFREDVEALLREVSVVVHASCLGEPFGQVVIEGMAAAKPVVATDGGALPEIITDGDTGRLVPMNDPDAMARAICRLIDNPSEAMSLAARGRQHVLDTFTIYHTARSMERVYDRLFSPAGPSLGEAVGSPT